MNPALAPTVFIVVGDHAPPFIRSSERNLFAGDRVPFVILSPRDEAADHAPTLAGSSQHPHPLPLRVPAVDMKH